MNNDELKKKILTIVRGAMLEADELPFVETTEYVADALIAAGIGDVKEAEYRMKVMEKKYKIALTNYAKLHRKETRYNKMTATYDEEITKQAEKELAEEKR